MQFQNFLVSLQQITIIEMKEINYLDEEIKNKIRKITWSILEINKPNTITYIRIGDDDELILDDFFSVETGCNFSFNYSNHYMILRLNDMKLINDEIKSYLPIINYIAKEEDKKYIKVNLTNIREYDDDEIFHIERIIEYIDEYGYGYHKSPEYQEEKKKIEKIIIEDEILPYVIDEINKAIDDYIRNKEFEVS